MWKGIPCTEHNGILTGYKIFVRETLTKFMSGSIIVPTGPLQSTMVSEVTELHPATSYSVSVAAMNSRGTGELSPEVLFETKGGNVYHKTSELMKLKYYGNCHCHIPSHVSFVVTVIGSHHVLTHQSTSDVQIALGW